MTSAMSRVVFPAGSVIFDIGDAADETYLIKSGEVELYTPLEEDGEMEINYLKHGQVFGEFALASSAPRTDRAKALIETECIVVNQKGLLAKVEQGDPFIAALFRILTANMRSVRALGDMENDPPAEADLDALSETKDNTDDSLSI